MLVIAPLVVFRISAEQEMILFLYGWSILCVAPIVLMFTFGSLYTGQIFWNAQLGVQLWKSHIVNFGPGPLGIECDMHADTKRCIVKTVQPGSMADMAKVQVNDKIVKVGAVNIFSGAQGAVEEIQKQSRPVTLTFSRLHLTGTEQAQQKDSENFTTAFSWALESYKKEIEGFELWNIISRTVIIVGSTIMYPENRFTTHFLVMSWSLLLHVRFRPYIDQESNVCAILFCICDIFGAITAFQTYANQPSAILQIFYILITFITMVVVGIATTRGIRAQAAASHSGVLGKKSASDLFASYTPLEKKLLFPILAIVWLMVKCLHKIDEKKGKRSSRLSSTSNNNNNQVKITPLTKRAMRRESSFLARNTVEQAEIAATIQKDKITMKRKVSKTKLENRIAKRNGTYDASKDVACTPSTADVSTPAAAVKVPSRRAPGGVKRTTTTTIKALAIQQNSERSRKKSIQLIQVREKNAQERLQLRLSNAKKR